MHTGAAGPAQSVGALPPRAERELFVSRAGADAEIAAEIARVLEDAGFGVILQQWDFANRHFMERMHSALAGGARVVALLSPDYLRSDHCQAEWMNAIAGDPLNRKRRLILLRIAECDPPGLLAGLAYWDLVPLRNNPALMKEAVLKAVATASREGVSRAASIRSDSHVEAVRPPTGTVTFLFTEIDDKTQRWERDTAAMRTAVKRHDAIVRAAIEQHGGYVFKAVGESFRAAFTDAAKAVAAAGTAQAALNAEDFAAVGGLRIRVALHSGTADERNGDYFGLAVHRTARLVAIGSGGQVLLSHVTAELARGMLEPGGLRDMGEHRLEDLSEPEHVFALDIPGAPTDSPLLRAAVEQGNLPSEAKTFIGRDADMAEVARLLARARIVTLVGVGGVGKTSCALKVAASCLADYEDGVWFVGFAAITDPALVATEAAAAFQLVESAKRPVLETLVAHLRKKHALIVLDNCEHVIDACSTLANALLHDCPRIKLLATSREALKVSGEHVYALPMLDVPDGNANVSVIDALGYGAVALFTARARAIDSRFELTAQNVASVAEICRRLDGIPLAIELAAARVRVLAPRQLAQKLDERFRILSGGARTALPRQQTMRALVDWSYDLLDARERTLFGALSIFTGTFSLESAIAVCAGDDIDEFDVLDGLTSLVEKSLAVADSSELDTRYRLLESLRQYGRERLDERGARAALADRHAEAYADLAERLESEYGAMSHRTWTLLAEREVENVRAALAWTFGPSGDAGVGLRLAATLHRIFNFSRPAEARRWVQTALARAGADASPRAVARLELADAHLASRLNQLNAALAAARRAASGFEAVGDRRGIASAKRWAGRSLIFLGEVSEGEALLRSALDDFEMLGFRQVGGVLLDLGSARSSQGDLAGARDFFAQALKRFEEVEDEGNAAITAGTLAEAEFRAGDARAALGHAQDALAAARHLNEHLSVWLQSNVAAFLVALDRFDDARQCTYDALLTAVHVESELYVAVLLQHLAAALALQSEPGMETGKARELSARLMGFVDRKFRSIEFAREYTEQQEYDRINVALRRALGDDAFTILIADGAAWRDENAVEIGLAAASTRAGDNTAAIP